MTASLNWANLVTVTRMGLIFVVVLLAYGQTMWDRLLAAVIAVLIIAGDWLDGHLARKLDQVTPLGSVLDIAADRILENVMWIILADLNLIPVWIPIVVISRGILTDSIRSYALSFGYSGFGKNSLQQTLLGKFLTGSPIMRTGYAIVKAFSFGWLLLFAALDGFLRKWPLFEIAWLELALEIGYFAAILSAVICIVRGIPVVVEGVGLIRRETTRA